MFGFDSDEALRKLRDRVRTKVFTHGPCNQDPLIWCSCCSMANVFVRFRTL